MGGLRAWLASGVVLAACGSASGQDGRALWSEFMDGVGIHFEGNDSAVKIVLLGGAVALVVGLNVLAARRLLRGGGARVEASMDGVRKLMRRGRKVEAIRMYRELTGAGLAEAKRAVEAGI